MDQRRPRVRLVWALVAWAAVFAVLIVCPAVDRRPDGWFDRPPAQLRAHAAQCADIGTGGARMVGCIRQQASADRRMDRAANVTPGWCGWDNSYTMDVLRGNEDWLAAVVLVDPLSPEGPAELARLAKQGASGLRIQPPCTGPLLDPRQTPLWQAANDLAV